MSKQNPRFSICKVKEIIPPEYVKEIMISNALASRAVRESVFSVGEMVNTLHEVHDSDSNLIITQLTRIESFLEKVLYISLISILISCLTLCFC